MRKSIEKILAMLILVFMIASINVPVFADNETKKVDYEKFKKICQGENEKDAIKLAEDVANEKTITGDNACEAVGDPNSGIPKDFVEKWCVKTLKKYKPFNKHFSELKKCKTVEEAMRNKIPYWGYGEKDVQNLAVCVNAYLKLKTIESAVKKIKPGDKASIKKAKKEIKDAEEADGSVVLNNSKGGNTQSQGGIQGGTTEEDTTPIYVQPNSTTTGEGSSASSLEDVTKDADDFINSAELPSGSFTESLQNFSKTMYNIFLTIGIFVAVIVGGIIGLKLMTSSAEGKAEAKAYLIPYVIGCVVVFGGFGIWKLVVSILQGM